MSIEDGENESEFLKNIKRLTVRVLDNLDEGSAYRTLDEQEKRLLSSTGTRLLRLWRIVQKEGESKRAAEAGKNSRAVDRDQDNRGVKKGC